MDHVWVRSGLLGDAVALWEREPNHPGGEIYVAGAGAVVAAMTPAVRAALKQGRLIRVEQEEPTAVDDLPAVSVRGKGKKR